MEKSLNGPKMGLKNRILGKKKENKFEKQQLTLWPTAPRELFRNVRGRPPAVLSPVFTGIGRITLGSCAPNIWRIGEVIYWPVANRERTLFSHCSGRGVNLRGERPTSGTRTTQKHLVYFFLESCHVRQSTTSLRI